MLTFPDLSDSLVTMDAHTLLRVTGTDAAPFLHAQLSVNVLHLAHDRHAFGAWCDSSGRALCMLRIIPYNKGFLLLLPTDLATAISKRLRMYVLRADVTIRDVSADWTVHGQLAASNDGNDTLPADGKLVAANGNLQLGIATGHGPGALLICSGQSPAGTLPVSANTWQLAVIDAGLPQITAEISALFVPQMLNLHWLDGIDFDKGCYPGQEIVARLQYRGQLKRRVFRLGWNGQQPPVGADVLDGNGKKQGTVIRCAAAGEDYGRLLAVVRVAASAETLMTNDARLTLLNLPYVTDRA